MSSSPHSAKGLPTCPPPVTDVPIIGIVLPSANPLELVEHIAPCLRGYRVLLFVNGMNPHLEAQVAQWGLHYTTDFNFFLLQAPKLSLVLTFGALPHPAHLHVNLAISLFNELEIPVMDIQHGLFQWGINFSDTSVKQGADNQSGCALPMDTVADVQVTWNGPNGIGYPRFTPEGARVPDATESNTIAPFILIATNTNWHIYQEEERQRFKHMLRQMFLDFPDLPFVWKVHPAENNPNLTSLHPLIQEARNDFPNVDIPKPVSQGGTSLTELVRKCRFGLSTVGTALLDFEMFKKPCLCFDSHAVRDLIASMPDIDTFASLEDLRHKLPVLLQNGSVPRTGHLTPFQPEHLSALINATARATRHKAPLSACLRAISLTKQLMS